MCPAMSFSACVRRGPTRPRRALLGQRPRHAQPRNQQVPQRGLERPCPRTPHQGDRCALAARGSVRAVGLQRAVTSGDREDARARENVLAAQPRRIGQAVPRSSYTAHSSPARDGTLRKSRAHAGMNLDALELLGRERLGFERMCSGTAMLPTSCRRRVRTAALHCREAIASPASPA